MLAVAYIFGQSLPESKTRSNQTALFRGSLHLGTKGINLLGPINHRCKVATTVIKVEETGTIGGQIIMSDIWKTIGRLGSILWSIEPKYGLTIVAIYATGFYFSSRRWRELLLGLGLAPRMYDVILANLAWLSVNNLTPGRVGGEVFRVALLKSRANLDSQRTAASAVYDRLMESAQFPLFFLLALPAAPQLLDRFKDGIGATGRHLPIILLVLALLAILAILVRRIERLRSWFRRYLSDLTSLGIRRRRLVSSMLSAQAVWVLDAVRLLVSARAMGVHISPSQALALSVSATIGNVVPVMGGLGVVEGTLVSVLMLYGVAADKAIAITLLDRAVSYGLVTAVGALVLVTIGGRRLIQETKPNGTSTTANEHLSTKPSTTSSP